MAVSFLQQLGYDDNECVLWDATSDKVLLSTAFPAEAAGVHYRNTGVQNVRAMNQALARFRTVTLTTPGQYLFGAPGTQGDGGIQIPAGRTLISDNSVEYILANQTFSPLIRNVNAFDPGILLTAVVTWVTGVQARIDSPGIGLKYPVGSWFGLLGLPGTSSTNRGYQGVWQVQVATNDSITFYLMTQPPSAGNSTANGFIYPADTGIRIIGGLWDGNESGQSGSGYNDGDPRGLIQSFRNCRDLIVKRTAYRKGLAWCFGSNNCRDMTISDIDTSTFSGLGIVAAHDIVHLAGGHRNVLIERISADCDDQIVGVTIDDIDGSATYPNYYPGDTYDLTVRDINGRECSATLVKLWGNINYFHHNTVVDRVTGKSQASAVEIGAPYVPTDMLNCNGGTLKVTNVSGWWAAAPISVRSEGVWDQILIDTVRQESVTSASAIVDFSRSTTTQSIKQVEIKNIIAWIPGSGNNRAAPAVRIADSNIDDLSIFGVNGMRLAANTSMIVFAGTAGSILRAVVEKANATSGSTTLPSGTSDTFVVSCENTNAAALGNLAIRDSAAVGGTGAAVNTGGVFRQSTAGRVTNVLIENSQQTGGEGLSVVDNGVNPATVTIR